MFEKARKDALAMVYELVVMRHAKSSWADPSLEDFERPLKGRGRRDAQTMGQWLYQQGWRPDLVYVSPARRAKQTIEYAKENLRLDESRIVFHRPLYFDGVAAHVRLLKRTDQAVQRLMLIGHNPDLDALVRHLSDRSVPDEDDGKLMTTAAVAWFEMTEPWDQFLPNRHSLKILQRPKWLGST